MQINKYHAKKVGEHISGYLASSALKCSNNFSFESTVDPRFSDTKLSDNPWYSDSFAADNFLDYEHK